jgi:hypothetical protein
MKCHSFTIVGRNSINYHQGLQNTYTINNINTTPWKTTLFIPNQLLDEQQRFLASIIHQMVNLPHPNTYEYSLYSLLRAYSGVFIK